MQIKYLKRRSGLSGQVYLLDLDNTLHMASAHILPEINRQMTQYLMQNLALGREEASQLRTAYWKRYGATLLGMMRQHGTNPHEFLAQTHQFDDLASASHRHGSIPARLARLNGPRILLTNAPRQYATALCKALGLYRHLHAIVAIEDMVIHQQWRPKPAQLLWPALRRLGRGGHRPVLLDDTYGHLLAAARYGIEGVWVTPPRLGFKPRALSGPVRMRLRQFEQITRRGGRCTPGRLGLSGF